MSPFLRHLRNHPPLRETTVSDAIWPAPAFAAACTNSMDEMAKVAAATTIPVATGENLQGLEDFTRLTVNWAMNTMRSSS